ncbi:hypothetical protein TELCIR_01825, partial [Teladorsagia circumcincta]
LRASCLLADFLRRLSHRRRSCHAGNVLSLSREFFLPDQVKLFPYLLHAMYRQVAGVREYLSYLPRNCGKEGQFLEKWCYKQRNSPLLIILFVSLSVLSSKFTSVLFMFICSFFSKYAMESSS